MEKKYIKLVMYGYMIFYSIQSHALSINMSDAAQQAIALIDTTFQYMEKWTAQQDFLYSDSKQTILSQTNLNPAFKTLNHGFKFNESSTTKITRAIQFMDAALDSLGAKIQDSKMQPLKQAAQDAITSLMSESKFDNKVLHKIIDSVKFVVRTPVEIACAAGIVTASTVAFSAHEAVTQFGAGVYKTAGYIEQQLQPDARFEEIGKAKSSFSDLKSGQKAYSLRDCATLLPRVVAAAVYGLVETAVLTAYMTAQAIPAGAMIGAYYADTKIGNSSFFQKRSVQQTSKKSTTKSQNQPQEINQNSSRNNLNKPSILAKMQNFLRL